MLFLNNGNGPKNCVKSGVLGVCITVGASVSKKQGNRTVTVKV